MFCVLAILSTLYCQTQGAEVVCKAVEDWTSAVVYAADVTCTDKPCVRPAMKTDGSYEAKADGALWGCGPCTTKEKCVECSTASCNTKPDFECYTNTDKSTQKVCPDKPGASGETSTVETECVRGKVTDHAGTMESGGDTKVGCATADTCSAPEKCTKCTGALCNAAETAVKHSCLKYIKDEDENWVKDGTNKVDCYDEVATGCKMFLPKDATAASTYAVCGSTCTADTTCKGCAEADCNDIDTAKTCKVGTKADGDTAAKAKKLPPNFCPNKADKCMRPSVSYGAVVDTAGVNYACGTCVADTKCANCDKSNCNDEWPMNNHKCFTWKLVEDKWAASEASVDCAAYDAEAKCSMPIDLTKKDGFTAEGGCGPCAAGTDATCKTTEADKNASQKTVISLLTVLMSLLYVML